MSIVEGETHNSTHLDRFTNLSSSTSTPKRSVVALERHSVSTTFSSSCHRMSDLTRNFHRDPEHVCGHASYGDLRTLFQRNDIYNDAVKKMLSSIVDRCAAVLPPLRLLHIEKSV